MKAELLPKETIIEVVSINKTTKAITKKEMTFGDWLGLKRNEKFTYIAYQKGFSSY